MKRFLVALVALSCLSVPAAGQKVVTIGSNQPFVHGSHAALAGPWSAWADPSIKDFSNSIRIHTATWPRDTAIHWRFPEKPASTGVYGYNYVAYGQYWDLKPPIAVPPRKLSAIKTLKFFSTIDTGGDTSKFNILAEFFVTKKPGDINSRVAEIGWLLNMPPASHKFFRMGRQIGIHRDGEGRQWHVAVHRDGAAGLYIMFAPAKPGMIRLTQAVDALAAVRWLSDKGEISLGTYFNGMAVGIEPLMGSGSAVVRRFDVAYK